MGINQGINYLVSRGGDQFGPVAGSDLVQLAGNGQILSTDHLWAEGMDGWTPATSFNELAAVFTSARHSPGTAMMETTPLLNNPMAPRTEIKNANVRTAVDTSGALHVDRKGVSGPGILKAEIRTASALAAEEPYRPGASFGLLLGSYLLMILGGLAYIAMTVFALVVRTEPGAPGSEEASSPGMQLLLDKPYIFFSVFSLMIVGVLWNSILTLTYLHRAWAYIQDLPNVATSPGKAVGLLFIPLFNLVWMFFAYYKWAGGYNLRCDLSKSEQGPQVKEGVFLAHCITTLLGVPVIYIFMMHQMCRSINHLATSPDLALVSSY